MSLSIGDSTLCKVIWLQSYSLKLVFFLLLTIIKIRYQESDLVSKPSYFFLSTFSFTTFNSDIAQFMFCFVICARWWILLCIQLCLILLRTLYKLANVDKQSIFFSYFPFLANLTNFLDKYILCYYIPPLWLLICIRIIWKNIGYIWMLKIGHS